MIRILAAAALLFATTSPAFSARLNIGDTDNPNLVYDPTTGDVELVPGSGAKNKIIGFVLANTTGVFTPEPDEVFESRTPWTDAVYDNLPKQIGSSDIRGIGGEVGQVIRLGRIFPKGVKPWEMYDLLSQADVLWKRGAGGKGALDYITPEPSTSLLSLTGTATLLAHKRRRRSSR